MPTNPVPAMASTMKAAVCTRYGPPEVVQIREVEKPTPKDNQLLIRVFATTVTSGDVRQRKADPWIVRLFFGLRRPRKPILGSDLAGEVVAAGDEARRFKPWGLVFGLVPSVGSAHRDAGYTRAPDHGHQV